nr:unnamed protein product [Callosobruchus analis]
MFTFTVSGDITPPKAIYPYKRLPSNVLKSVPADWGIGCSDSGWMKNKNFYKYIGNLFINKSEDARSNLIHVRSDYIFMLKRRMRTMWIVVHLITPEYSQQRRSRNESAPRDSDVARRGKGASARVGKKQAR